MACGCATSGGSKGSTPTCRSAIHRMEDLTRDNAKLELNVCFNYGGRAEIVDAVREIVARACPPSRSPKT